MGPFGSIDLRSHLDYIYHQLIFRRPTLNVSSIQKLWLPDVVALSEAVKAIVWSDSPAVAV